MHNKKSNGKGNGTKVTVGGDAAFDDMLAELRAGDVTAEVTTTNSSNARSMTSGVEVTEAMIIQASKIGNVTQLRQWAKRGVRVSSAEPLCQAVGYGMISAVRCLAKDLGADG